ncbi:MAG TPA: LamG-like jellyroll fold domain-containing protein [Sunxiuqinia sp.]|nr:LamG-like jellyroll fold domain-containing protein [Sunxiuqinia sp.]
MKFNSTLTYSNKHRQLSILKKAFFGMLIFMMSGFAFQASAQSPVTTNYGSIKDVIGWDLDFQHIIYVDITPMDVVGNNDPADINAIFALSQDTISAWGDFAMAIRIDGNDGDTEFTTHDGTGYQTTGITWNYGQKYHFWIDLDVPNQKFNLYFQTEGMDAPAKVADNFSFRNTSTTVLKRWGDVVSSQDTENYLKSENLAEVSAVGDFPAALSSVATLSSISVDTGTLEPAFSDTVTTYSLLAPDGTTAVNVAATPSVNGATVSGDGTIDVSSGSGTATMVVTALDGVTTKTYTIDITVEDLSKDASLTDISLSTGGLDVEFDPETLSYTATVPKGATSVDVSVTTKGPNSTVTGDGTITLTGGTGTANIVVTAEDAVTTQTYTVTFAEANGNYAISLPGGDGNNSNVDISGLGLFSLPFTVEMWIKPEGDQTDNSGLFFYRPDNVGLQYASGWQGSGKLRFLTNSTTLSGDPYYGVVSQVATPDEWHHVAIVLTADSRTIVVDGVANTTTADQVGEGGFNAIDFSLNQLYLGWDSDGAAKAFKGLIDEVRVWDVAKDSASLENDKFKVLNGDESNLAAYWNFDDYADQATDVSGNFNTGTINGGKYVVSDFMDKPLYDATLSNLTVDKGSLTPEFSSSTTAYLDLVPAGTMTVIVGATTTNTGAVVTGTGAIDVSSGSGTASVIVTSANGQKTMTYTVQFTVSAQSDNLIENWDGNGITGDASSPDLFGWAGAGSWNTANSGGGVRYIDKTAGTSDYTYNGAEWTGRLLYTRWDGSGSTSTSTVFSYPVQLEACKSYKFSGKYGWNSNGSGTSTYTVSINSAMDNSGTSLASQEYAVADSAKMQFFDASFTFIPSTSGTYYLTISNDLGILGAVADLSITEDNSESLIVSENSLEFNTTDLEKTFMVSGNALTNDITLTAPSGITLDMNSVTKGDAQCGVVVTATFDGAATTNGNIIIGSGSFSDTVKVVAYGPATVETGQDYYIQQEVSGLVMGEDTAGYNKLYAASLDSMNQVFQLAESGRAGEYFLKNKKTGYLSVATTNTWNLVFTADTTATTENYRFTLTEFEPGRFYVHAVSKSASQYVGTDATTAGSGIYSDKAMNDNAVWKFVLPDDISTGINPVKNELGLKAYPIPFHNGVQVELNGRFSYQLFNLSGAMVSNGLATNQIHIGDQLNPGIYLLKVNQKENTKTIKLVKF